MNTSVLRTVNTLSGPECIFRCFNDNCCRSVNYNKRCSSAESEDNCELLHDVASENPEQLKFEKNFDHLVLLQPIRVGVATFRRALSSVSSIYFVSFFLNNNLLTESENNTGKYQTNVLLC